MHVEGKLVTDAIHLNLTNAHVLIHSSGELTLKAKHYILLLRHEVRV